jgi:hypothetical protein
LKKQVLIIAAAMIVVIGLIGSASSATAARTGPFLVVEDLHFLGLGGVPGGCDFLVADVTNYGDLPQQFGWSWTVAIPKLGLTHTFVGQQALAPGETRLLFHNPGAIPPGTYLVKVSVSGVDGRTKSDRAVLRVPC